MEGEFSVLMSVYYKENPVCFNSALESILINQFLKPNEVVIVKDGQLTRELENIIKKYYLIFPEIIRVYGYEKNMGLGYALNFGMDKCSYNLIARMDTDDIAHENRFYEQIKYFSSHENCTILGGQIEEFKKNIDFISSKRNVPLTNKEIKKYIKKRNPFNHMTVMFKKGDIQFIGGYHDFYLLEDYYLWCKLIINNMECANLDKTLVYVRVTDDMYKRRGGYEYFKSFVQLEKYKLLNDIITSKQFFYLVVMRFFLQVLCPNRIRKIIFLKYARSLK